MPDITSLLSTGASSQRIDFVFVAEGYQASERAKFLADATRFLEYMVDPANGSLNQPFSGYRKYFNASALFVASNQSGLDTFGASVDTYFNAGQRNAGGRLIYGDNQKVAQAVSDAYAANAHEVTVVLMNSTLYGGAGGSTAWVTAGNPSSAEAMLHEIGHTFASLEDEYADASLAGFGPVTGLDSVHLSTSPSQVPWTAWLGYSDLLGTVGTFEGGFYRSTGVYRATLDSKMFHLGVPFNAPEKEAFALAYYKGIGDYLSFDASIPGLVKAVVPDAAQLSFAWNINGVDVWTIDQNYLDLYSLGTPANGATVKLTTTDKSGFIRTELSATSQRELLNVSGTGIQDITDQNYTLTQSQAVYRFGADNNQIYFGSAIKADYVDGGAGEDTIVFDLPASRYALTELSTGLRLFSFNGAPLVAVKNVEFARFSDVTVKLSAAFVGVDSVAPVILAFSPNSELGGFQTDANVITTFDEPIQRGYGNVVLKTVAGTVIEVFDAAGSTRLSIAGSKVTIDPSADLTLGTDYKLEFAAGTIKDLSGNTSTVSTALPFKTLASIHQKLLGTGLNDVFMGGSGNDTIDGASGIDTAVYAGRRSGFSLNKSTSGGTVTDNAGTEGVDTLTNIERLQFSDVKMAFDTGPDQSAGKAALLLGSVLPGLLALDSSKQPLMGVAIGLFDAGFSFQQLSGAIQRLPIWDVLTGLIAPTNTDIANYLLTNINGRVPDQTTLNSAVAEMGLETGEAQGSFLAQLASGASAQTHIGLVGLGQTGLEYL
jgi:hypothetical protein